MSELTREQVEKMFGVGNGFKMSVWPFEIQPQTAQAFLAHDAAQRAQREQDLKRIQELEEWQRIVMGTGTDQEAVIRMAATEYTKTAVQCWRAQREQDLQRIQGIEEDNTKAWFVAKSNDDDNVRLRADLSTLTQALAQARGALELALARPWVGIESVVSAERDQAKEALALAVPAAGGGEKPSKDYGIYSPEVERDLSENYTSSSARDAAAPAPTPGLVWTTERPTVPGHYWWQSTTPGADATVVEVGWTQHFLETESHLGCFFIGEPYKRVSSMTGHWAGPLPEPKGA